MVPSYRAISTFQFLMTDDSPINYSSQWCRPCTIILSCKFGLIISIGFLGWAWKLKNKAQVSCVRSVKTLLSTQSFSIQLFQAAHSVNFSKQWAHESKISRDGFNEFLLLIPSVNRWTKRTKQSTNIRVQAGFCRSPNGRSLCLVGDFKPFHGHQQ